MESLRGRSAWKRTLTTTGARASKRLLREGAPKWEPKDMLTIVLSASTSAAALHLTLHQHLFGPLRLLFGFSRRHHH